jgi:hypothetical protein
MDAVELNIKRHDFQTIIRRELSFDQLMRRALTIFVSDPLMCKQALAKFGQTCLRQFSGGYWTATRSAFANAKPLASAAGITRGNATTEIPNTANIARDATDLIIYAADGAELNPLCPGDHDSTTYVNIGSDTTTYI